MKPRSRAVCNPSGTFISEHIAQTLALKSSRAAGGPVRSRPVLTGTRAIVQPHIHSRRVPVVGLIQQVEVAVAIQIRKARLMPTVANNNLRLLEIALAISVKHPSRGFGMIARRFFFAPLGHFRAEDVKVAIAVDIAELQAVPVDHLAANQTAALDRKSVV